MLRRRDKTAHAISYARALLSGIWRKEQEVAGRAEPEYSPIAFERAGRMIEDQEAAWTAMFADLGIAPFELWHEDVVADPDGAALAIAAYLGVALDPGAVVEIPEVERQSQAGARAWAERHAASTDITPPNA
jgi:LPS sulfotransferase NodH